MTGQHINVVVTIGSEVLRVPITCGH